MWAKNQETNQEKNAGNPRLTLAAAAGLGYPLCEGVRFWQNRKRAVGKRRCNYHLQAWCQMPAKRQCKARLKRLQLALGGDKAKPRVRRDRRSNLCY